MDFGTGRQIEQEQLQNIMPHNRSREIFETYTSSGWVFGHLEFMGLNKEGWILRDEGVRITSVTGNLLLEVFIMSNFSQRSSQAVICRYSSLKFVARYASFARSIYRRSVYSVL